MRSTTHHCGACGRGVIKNRHVWMHRLEFWDHDYLPHEAEPIRG
jgi:hypothetical protein